MWKLRRCPHCAGRLEKKDRAIFPLVHALNMIDGVDTTYCCAGHSDDDVPYVSFVCKNYLVLKRLANRLTPLTSVTYDDGRGVKLIPLCWRMKLTFNIEIRTKNDADKLKMIGLLTEALTVTPLPYPRADARVILRD